MTEGSTRAPVATYLHGVFPRGDYPADPARMIESRLYWPRPDAEPVSLAKPIDWESTGHGEDRNWRMLLQSFGMLHPLIDLYDDSSDKNHILEYAADIFQDWWEAYGDDPDDIVTSRMPDSYAWYDMSVGYRALIVAFFLDRTDGGNNQELVRVMTQMAQKHRSHLRNPAVFYPNNHGIFQMHGLMALARLSDDPRSADDAAYAEQKMAELADGQFDSNGVHTEHSPEYHVIVLRTFERVLESGWYSNQGEIAKHIEAANRVVGWFCTPDSKLVAVGDSTRSRVEFAIPGQTPTDPLVSSDFDDSGYAVVRSHWSAPAEEASYLIFVGAYNSRVHKHRDCLSFEWYDQGSMRVVDSGKYGYNTDSFRTYALSNRAHNTVEIEGFDVLKMSPYGSAIEGVDVDSRVAHLRGELGFKAFTHERNLYLLAGHWLIVDDLITAQRDRKATQWTHLPPSYELSAATDERGLFRSGSDVLVLTNLTPGSRSIHYGDPTEMQGFVSESENQIDAGFAIGLESRGRRMRQTTAIALSESDELSAIAFGQHHLRLPGPRRKPILSPGLNTGTSHMETLDSTALQFGASPMTYTVHSAAGPLRIVTRGGSNGWLIVDLGDGTSKTHFINDQLIELGHFYLSVADPTLDDSRLDVGWFQGSPGGTGIPAVVELIRSIQATHPRIQETVLVGHGVGGFGAHKVAAELKSRLVAQEVVGPRGLDDAAFAKMLRHAYSRWDPEVVPIVFERYIESEASKSEDVEFGPMSEIAACVAAISAS